ncbi:MAG: hypothetical protein GY696_03070 [Gammaproteobacteria bacterium]|nr:hypothetical protein [Gammaproteobacteria bacterium]
MAHIICHYLSGTAMNSVEAIRGELVVLIEAIEVFLDRTSSIGMHDSRKQ